MSDSDDDLLLAALQSYESSLAPPGPPGGTHGPHPGQGCAQPAARQQQWQQPPLPLGAANSSGGRPPNAAAGVRSLFLCQPAGTDGQHAQQFPAVMPAQPQPSRGWEQRQQQALPPALAFQQQQQAASSAAPAQQWQRPRPQNQPQAWQQHAVARPQAAAWPGSLAQPAVSLASAGNGGNGAIGPAGQAWARAAALPDRKQASSATMQQGAAPTAPQEPPGLGGSAWAAPGEGQALAAGQAAAELREPAAAAGPGIVAQPLPGSPAVSAEASVAAAPEAAPQEAIAAAAEHEAAPEAAAGVPEAAPAAAAGGAEPAPKKRRLKQLFDYLLVLDIEATCDRDKANQPLPQEIIELSCVVVDTATLKLGGRWQCYVRPDQHPRLTEFCTELTGITQEQVDAGVPLRFALQQLDGWLREQGLVGQGKTLVPVTWRDWDLKVMLAGECKWRGIEAPKYFKRWVDISAVWFKHHKHRGNLRASVEAAGLAWEGRAHCALDDAANTARLAIKIMRDGVILTVTGSFGNLDSSGRLIQPTLLGFASGSGSGKGAGSGKGGGGGRGGGSSGGGRGGGSSGGGKGGGRGSGGRHGQQGHKRAFDAAGVWTGKCFCGVAAKKRQVKKPGPNLGRHFWSCGKYTATGGAGCDFFQLVALDGSSGAAAGAAAGSGKR